MKIWIIVILGFAAMVSFIMAFLARIEGNYSDAIYNLILSFYLFYQADSMDGDIKNDKS